MFVLPHVNLLVLLQFGGLNIVDPDAIPDTWDALKCVMRSRLYLLIISDNSYKN